MTLPPDQRRSPHWEAKAAEVEAAHGEWVLVGEGVSSNVPYRISTGAVAAFRPPDRYEVHTRRTNPRARPVNVWVRVKPEHL